MTLEDFIKTNGNEWKVDPDAVLIGGSLAGDSSGGFLVPWPHCASIILYFNGGTKEGLDKRTKHKIREYRRLLHHKGQLKKIKYKQGRQQIRNRYMVVL